MVTASLPRGPGLFRIRTSDTERPPLITNIRRIAGADTPPGEQLIAAATILLGLLGGGFLYVTLNAQYHYIFAVKNQSAASMIEASGLDAGLIIFSLLALGLARAGQAARTERALILGCALASAGMQYEAADTTSPRALAVYVMPPVFLAIVVDRVIAVVRRWVTGDSERSAWAVVGRAVVAAARLAGLVLLYGLRFILAPPETARGLRRLVLDAAPLPALPPAREPEAIEPPRTKKAALLALYRAHPAYRDRAKASQVAAQLAPQAGLQPGTARTYLYEELARQNGDAQ